MTDLRRLAAFGPHFLLVSALLVAAAAGSCSSSSSDTSRRTIDSTAGNTGTTITVTNSTGGQMVTSTGGIPMIAGLTGLTVSVDNPNISVTYGQPAGSAKITVTGTFGDGSMRDVSGQVGLSVDPGTTSATIAGTTFNVSAPGVYTITASANDATATVVVTVTLTGTFQPIDPMTNMPKVPAATSTALDGTPSAACTPTIAYPYPLAMFPLHMQSEFQITGATQGFVRFHFSGTLLPDPGFTTYAVCNAIPGTNACSAIVPAEVANVLAGASTGDAMSVDVRLTNGSCVGQSVPEDVRWSFLDVTGALYYWRTLPYQSLNLCGLPDRTGIYRFDFDHPEMPPERYTANIQDIPMPLPNACMANTNPPACVGCHAVTYNGDMISFAYNGSDVNQMGSRWAIWTVATKQVLADTTPNAFGNFTAFAPDGATMVNELSGGLTLHTVGTGLASLGAVFASVGEQVTHPYWSAPSGLKFAFTGYQQSANVNNNGDVVQGGEIYVGDSDGHTMFSNPTLVAPREGGVSKYYPAITDDDRFVIYNQSSCSGPPAPSTAPYGKGACDGYDDASAQLMITGIGGGGSVALANANGAGKTWANSWPRLSPTHATYRGVPIYWVAFSSRRDYGVRIPGSLDGSSKPQLWIAAVAPGVRGANGDPSFVPVWIPGQDDLDPTTGKLTVTGNHVPQWVKKFIPIKVN